MNASPDLWNDLPAYTTVAELAERFGEPSPVVRDKVRGRIHPVHAQWISHSPLLFLATAGTDGRCDVSPKGDPAGFVRVLDERTLAIPERSGNRRFDAFSNILANPHVGLNFVVPGRTDTLRVNGAARLVREAPFFDDMQVRGSRPLLVVLVRVQEVYFHCGKAMIRSGTWQPDSWRPDELPSHAQLAKAVLDPDAELADLEEVYRLAYTEGLYPDEHHR
ncbi:MAG: pyridoxamine 5'-phosphate oxidase family protein [Actinomycetales bacterium]